MATVGTLAALLLVTGCGNAITTEIVGATAVSLDRSGAPQFSLAVCSGSVGVIDLYGPHQGDESTSQRPIGVWRAATPVTADTVVNLENPGPPWTVERDPGALKPGERYSAFGSSTTEDEEISQVDFTLRRLGRLRAGQALFRSSRIIDSGALHSAVCR